MAKSHIMPGSTPSLFELPKATTADQIIDVLTAHAHVKTQATQPTSKSFYDSFDWRLYGNGLLAELTTSPGASTFALRHLDAGGLIASDELERVPAFGRQFDSPQIRAILEPILEMRALLPLCHMSFGVIPIHIVNDDAKTVLRLRIEVHQHARQRLQVQAIKGYGDVAERITELLIAALGLTPIQETLLLPALQQLQRKPKDYTSKLTLHLAPNMRADIASKYIYSHLLKTIKDNEHGVMHDIDSEFLHDFRVAVRRTRAGLSQIKGVLPDAINAKYTEFFCWLGQITTPTRDLDVYLLNFPGYQNSLPASMRADLSPLYDFLLDKQQKAQRELAKKLQSEQYRSTIAQWESYLKEQAPIKPPEAHANLSIKQMADLRIWKVFNRLLHEGDAISEQSPPEQLHELRKTGKKLRYLLEFFQSLYPEKSIRRIIDSLRALQDVLGEFQDYQVQQNQLQLFSNEMADRHIAEKTLAALDVLIQNLDGNKRRARDDFGRRYALFRHADNKAVFKQLFAR